MATIELHVNVACLKCFLVLMYSKLAGETIKDQSKKIKFFYYFKN